MIARTNDPHTTTNWAKGAAGEREIGALLDALGEAGVVAIHDRLRPGTKANIDHVAVAPSGVWVIDPKCYQGEVTRRDVGGWFSTDVRLYVGRRNCMKLVTAMSKQVDAVREALGSDWAEVPVGPILCFVGPNGPCSRRRSSLVACWSHGPRRRVSCSLGQVPMNLRRLR